MMYVLLILAPTKSGQMELTIPLRKRLERDSNEEYSTGFVLI